MEYKPWFERKPFLLNEEIAELNSCGFSFIVVEYLREHARKIVLKGTIPIDNDSIELELEYPSEFPYFPIVVKAKDQVLSRHQNPFEKNLCVIPHDQEGWDSTMTGADMVKQAIRLLEDSRKGQEALAANEVDSPEPWSNFLPFTQTPLFLSENIPQDVNEVGTYLISGYDGHKMEVTGKVGVLPHFYYVLEEINEGSFKSAIKNHYPFQQNQARVKFTGYCFCLPTPPSYDIQDPHIVLEHLENLYSNKTEVLNLKRQLHQYRKLKPIVRKKTTPPQFALIFEEENYERNNFRKAFIWGIYNHEEKRFLYSNTQYLNKEEHYRRIPDLSQLDSKKVFIAGLGSLGSAVAIELGKSGVGSFVLADRDSLEVGNLVRHTGTMDYIGMRKSKVLEEQILAHYPFAKVERVDGFIGYDVDIMNTIYERVNSVDLIINLSAEDSVIYTFNRLSLELHIPVIHAWISNGAWGGRVIRTLPGKTGCYHCFLAKETVELSSSPEGEIYPRGCGFPTFAGASFDIYTVATQTARLAVQTLLGHELKYDQIIVQNYPEPKIKLEKNSRNPECMFCGD